MSQWQEVSESVEPTGRHNWSTTLRQSQHNSLTRELSDCFFVLTRTEPQFHQLYIGGIFVVFFVCVFFFLSCVTRSLTPTTAVVMCVVTISPFGRRPEKPLEQLGFVLAGSTVC